MTALSLIPASDRAYFMGQPILSREYVAPVWLDAATGEPSEERKSAEFGTPPIVHPAWCSDCSTDVDGSIYHGSGFTTLDLVDEGGAVTEAWVSAHRLDDEDGTQSPTSVTVTFGHDGFDITPANARELAELLISTADLIEGVTR